MSADYDVIVMGGGPAGSTVSALLAEKGRRVLVLEKETYPRHHIGESLIPMTYWPLKRLGLLDKMKASPNIKKYSVQFITATGKESRAFYFFETNPHESSQTWQVKRAEFDVLMLNNAREKGAEVHEAAMVQEVIFEGEQAVGVRYRKDGEIHEARCKVVVDATGLNAFLSRRLKWYQQDPALRKAALYGYFKGAYRDAGIDEGATLVIRTADAKGWWWYIPLHDDIMSVGIVSTPERVFSNDNKDRQKLLMAEIEACEPIRKRLVNATQVDKVYSITDYSQRSSRIAGPGFVLVGDAYGFIDPLFSTGVLLATSGGCMAADSIEDALQAGDYSAERLGQHAPVFNAGIERFRKMVYAFYADDFSFGKFVRRYPEHHKTVVDVLIGDVYKDEIDAVFEPMKEYLTFPDPIPTEEMVEKR